MILLFIFKTIVSIKIVINLFILQKYIIFLFIIIDIIFILKSINPYSWEEFEEQQKIFSWYSGFFYFKKEEVVNFIFFIIISKIILIIQILIGIDLILIRIFKNRIKNRENLLYKVFIIIPWIYLNLIIEKTKNIKNIKKKEIKILLANFIFINMWCTSKLSIKNTLILIKSWKNWKKHTYLPRIKFLKFLKLTKEYYFIETENKYLDEYTY